MGQPAARVTDMQTCPMVTGYRAACRRPDHPRLLHRAGECDAAGAHHRYAYLRRAAGSYGAGFVHSLGRGYAGLPRW